MDPDSQVSKLVQNTEFSIAPKIRKKKEGSNQYCELSVKILPSQLSMKNSTMNVKGILLGINPTDYALLNYPDIIRLATGVKEFYAYAILDTKVPRKHIMLSKLAFDSFGCNECSNIKYV